MIHLAQLQVQDKTMVVVQGESHATVFLRNAPFAKWANSWGDTPPRTRACSMCLPETPNTLLAILASFTLAVSSSRSNRLRGVVRDSISLRRYRSYSRSSRNGLGGTKLFAIKPWRTSSASHSRSLTSVFRPGTCLIG